MGLQHGGDGGYDVLREGFVDCGVCTLSMHHSKDGIKRHLSTAHGMDFKEYEER